MYMNIKEEILKFLLKSKDRNIRFEDIKEEFIIEYNESFVDFNKALNSLIDDNLVFVDNHCYCAIDNSKYYIGVIDFINGRNVIRFEKSIFYISDCIKEKFNVMIDDEVIFKILFGKDVELIKLIRSNKKQIVCCSRYSKRSNRMTYFSDKIKKFKIEINNDNKVKVKNKDYLLVNIIKRTSNVLFCDIVENLGNENLKGNDITKILLENNVRINFDTNINKELKQYSDNINPIDFKNRVNLTDEFTITIDGDDAKDFDDAISISNNDDCYNLKVHIADVSYYVKKDSELDKEAYKRGTSIYVCDRVVPMLPFKLSNELCSLKPNVNRLALTCDMNINYTGEIIDYKIYESIINSDYRMTYSDVNKMYDNDVDVLNKYKSVKMKFYDMLTLSKIIRKKRFDEGAIDFEKEEAKVVLDDNGFPVDFKIRERGLSEKMIEDFMILANVCVAKHMKWACIPNMYRIHQEPKEQELANFISYTNKLGYTIKGKNHTSLSLQTSLNYFSEKPEYIIVKELLLKSMQKAVYSNECLGHFGLGLKEYCHFTSPIRRYPDLLVARMIKKYIINENKYDQIDEDEKYLGKSSNQCNIMERLAITVERKVDDIKKAEYMSQFINHKFKAIITSVHQFGFFVELPNTIEGLVRTNNFPIYLEYDNLNDIYFNEEYNVSYTVGQYVNVTCKYASKDTGKIEFSLNLDKAIKKMRRWI